MGSSRGISTRRLGQLADRIRSQQPFFFFLLFIFNFFLVYPLFFPSLIDLGPFDEMNYLNSGRSLIEGTLPSLAGNPLVAVLYGILYVFVQKSPYWIIYLAGLGRMILFTLLWVSAMLVATQIDRPASPYIMAGVLLVAPVLQSILTYPSDAFFAAISGLAFWQVLVYYNTRGRRHLWFASGLLGLAALARSDGLILIPILLFVVLVLTFQQEKAARTWLNSISAAVLPFAFLVGGFLLLHGAVTGSFDLGLSGRSYLAFEQGQELVYQAESGNPTFEAQKEAERLFGTAEENNYSVLKAISHNPKAFLLRLKATLLNLPGVILAAYDKRLASVLFLFALWGLIRLILARKYVLTALFLLWPLHLGVYFLTFFRPGYLHFIFFDLFALAAVGIDWLVSSDATPRLKAGTLASLVILGCYGIVDNKLAVFAGASIFFLGLILIWTGRKLLNDRPNTAALGLGLMLALGLITAGQFPSPVLRTLGDSAEERAIVFMSETLAPGSLVASYAPGHVRAARMSDLNLAGLGQEFDSPESLLNTLRSRGVSAIYSTHLLRQNLPQLSGLIEDLVGNGLVRPFRQDPHDVQVLIVEP